MNQEILDLIDAMEDLSNLEESNYIDAEVI